MFEDIDENTVLKVGSILQDKETKRTYRISSIFPDGRFQINMIDRDTLVTSGIIFAGSRATIARDYQIQVYKNNLKQCIYLMDKQEKIEKFN